jgi:CarboxypepD_reg-like domain
LGGINKQRPVLIVKSKTTHMTKYLRLIGLLIGFFTTQTLFGQSQLRGRVVTTNGKPVPAASVYLSNTTIGTISGEDGFFLLSPIPLGRFELVVSCLGYETKVGDMDMTKISDSLVITLVPKIINLEAVTIGPDGKGLGRKWNKWSPIFIKYFIGVSPYAKQCKITNPQVLIFKRKTGRLEVTASAPLILKNEALGYQITYELERFNYDFNNYICTYSGHPRFTEMATYDTTEANLWQKNRKDVYEGSMMHFMRSVYRNRLLEEGFQVTSMKKIANKIFAQMGMDGLPMPLQTADSIAFAQDSATVYMMFDRGLVITYPNKKMPQYFIDNWPWHGAFYQYTNDGLVIKKKPSELYQPTDPITSNLFLSRKGQGVYVQYNGHYYFPEDLLFGQYWALSETVGTLMPLDYGNPVPSNAQVAYKRQ